MTSAVTTPAACETTGVRTYTAKVTFEDKEYTDTKTEVIPATGHAYGEPVWKWNDDFKATATFTCTNDATHVENVTAEVTSAVTTPAACETTGVRTYTAKVTFEDKEYTDTKTEVIPATGHAYGEPVWSWTDDFKATATFTCANNDAHVENVTATVTNAVTTEATCEADGVRTYTAKVTFGGRDYTDTKTETLSATGHAYGTPVWKWNDDFTASATFTCGNDTSHVKNVTAEVTSAVTTPAACETTGVRTYTAKVTFEDKEYTDTKTEVIPATGHAYGEPVWKWNDDFKATATFTCTNDATHVENVTAEVTSAVTTPAACETTGVRTYTAKVTFEDKEYTDTKTEVIPATGHAYGEPVWSWTDDFKATATFTCANNDAHVENVTATVTNAVTTEATCEADGVRTYTAKVTFGGRDYTDTKTETLSATGHAYGTPVWKWNDDFTASATFTCGNDTSHVKNVTAEVTSAVTTPAACETTGVRTYTAKVTFEGKGYTDTKTETLPATSHDTELVGAKDATCTEDGYTGDEVCKVCGVTVKQGEVIPALGHDYKDGKCSRCGAEEPTTPVEPGKPATGDSSTLVLWLALLAISGMAVTVIPSRKKRSR